MAEGWRCPTCETVYAPWVARCMRCPPRIGTDTGAIPHETGTNVAHIVTGRCPACGGVPNAPMGTGCPPGSHYSTT